MREAVCKIVVVALLSLSVVACWGCDSVTGPSSSERITQGQVEALVQQINQAVNQGVANALSRVTFGSLTSLLATPRTALLNTPIFGRSNCTAGGRIEVSGNISGNDPVGTTFTVLAQLNTTITDWQCIGGVIVNGDPYLSTSGSIRVTGGNASFDFRDGGGFKWVPVGGGPGGSCQQDITTSGGIGGGFSSGRISCQPGNVVYTVDVRF